MPMAQLINPLCRVRSFEVRSPPQIQLRKIKQHELHSDNRIRQQCDHQENIQIDTYTPANWQPTLKIVSLTITSWQVSMSHVYIHSVCMRKYKEASTQLQFATREK